MLDLVRRIVGSRDLVWQLALRNMKAGRKQSVLGLGWIVFQPLAQMVVFTIVFSRIAGIQTKIPYAIFCFSGLVPWQFVASALRGATESVVQSATLVRKIYFPREVLVLAAGVSSFVNFGISFAVLLVLLPLFGIPIRLGILWVVPLALVMGCLVLGAGLILAALNVFVRDVFNALPLFVQIWFYATPIVYPLDRVPERLAHILRINPMTPIAVGFQRSILEGTPPGLGVLYSLAVAVVVLAVGYWFFRKAEMFFADLV